MRSHFPQVRALCPAMWHLPQTRARLVGGGLSGVGGQVTAEEEGPAEETEAAVGPAEETATEEGLADGTTTDENVVDGMFEVRGTRGRGHTSSRASSGQYSLMWLYKYHCLSGESPDLGTTGGSCCADGVQVLSSSRLKCSLSESHSIFTLTDPGAENEMEK